MELRDLPNYDMMLQFKNQETIDYNFLVRMKPKEGVYFYFTARR